MLPGERFEQSQENHQRHSDDPTTTFHVDGVYIDGAVEDLSGNRLINAPEWTVNLTVEPWRFDIAGGSITPRLQLRYESSAFLRVRNKPSTGVTPSPGPISA